MGKTIFAMLFAVLVSGSIVSSAGAQTVVPIGNDANWHNTDLMLRNTTGAPISQPTGTLVYVAPNGQTLISTSSVTVPAHGTALIVSAETGFAPGHKILPIAAGLKASVWLRFRPESPCNPAFEVQGLDDPLTLPGSFRVFHMLRIDELRHIGSWPTVLNTDAVPHTLTARVLSSPTIYTETWIAAPGLSQIPISTQLPNGGDVEIYLGSPGIGGNAFTNPVYVFISTGPTDGGTQAIRYGEAN